MSDPRRPSLPYADLRKTPSPVGVRTSTQPVPTVVQWTPEEISLIRHIAEATGKIQAEQSSAAIFTDAHATMKRELAIALGRLKLAVVLLATSLLTVLGGIALSWLVARSQPPTLELPAPLPIPVVEPSPNAAQVQSQGDDLQQIRSDLDKLLQAERARAEEAPKPKRKPSPR